MERIYGVFDNDLNGSLEALRNEKEEIEDLFRTLKDKLPDDENGRLDWQLGYNQGFEDFKKTLIKQANRMTIFHFSGHHGKEQLHLNDEKINDDAIIDILNNAKRLKIVFLNGCNTEVAIRKLTNVPIVIGTNKAVFDELAKEISTTFYNLLTQDLEHFLDSDEIESIFNQAKSFQSLTNKEIKRGGGAYPKEQLKKDLSDYVINVNKKTAKDFDIRVTYYGNPSKYPVPLKYGETVNNWFQRQEPQAKEKLEETYFHANYPKNFSQILEILSFGDWNDSKIGSELSEDRFNTIKDLYFTLLCFLRFCGYSLLWTYHHETDTKIDTSLKKEIEAQLRESWYTSTNSLELENRINHIKSVFKELSILKERKIPDSQDFFQNCNQFIVECIRFLNAPDEKLLTFCLPLSASKRNKNNTLTHYHFFDAEKFLYFFVNNCGFLINYRMVSVHDSLFFKYRIGKEKYKYNVKYFAKGPFIETREPEEFTNKIYEVYSILLKDKRKKQNAPPVLNLSPFYFDNNIENPGADEIELKCFDLFRIQRNKLSLAYCESDKLGKSKYLPRNEDDLTWNNIRIYYHIEQLLLFLK